jgi:hypothetical protein
MAMHAQGIKVIPVFDVRYPYCGRGDKVTVLDTHKKRVMYVNHGDGNRAALTDFVPSQFNQSDFGRLLKWPSGELPADIQPMTVIGGSALGLGQGIMGIVDEITISNDTVHSPYAASGFVIYDQQGIDAGDTSFAVGVRASHGGSSPPGGSEMQQNQGSLRSLEQNGGLIKIDDEIIGVVDASSGAFSRLKRGALGSTAASHPEGSRIYIIPYPRASALTGGLSEDIIPCRDPGETPREGYIQVITDNGAGEILPYRSKDRNSLRRYRDINGVAVFRGAFGSPQTGCDAGHLGVFIPYRYHDLYEANVDSREGVYFYAVNNFNYAYFRSITWDATIPQGTITKVQVRVDGQPGWDATPSNQKGGIFEFTDPTEDNLIDVMGQRVEIRVYLTYEQDAYLTDAWKDTPIIRSITLQYDQQCIVHHHETPNE